MKTKTFNVITLIAFTLTAAMLSVIDISITGLYPGIIVLCLVALIPIIYTFYVKKISGKSNDFQGNYYKIFTIINLLSISSLYCG
jgi:hypothetical protein